MIETDIKQMIYADHRQLRFDDLSDIWSDDFTKITAFQLWRAHIDWLVECGFEAADKNDSIDDLEHDPEHEVVAMLYEFVKYTGKVNAHFGLTSSDIVDNVRLVQLAHSEHRIEFLLNHFMKQFCEMLDSDKKTIAFTHLMPASSISWNERVSAWITPLIANSQGPRMHAKKFGGSVGNSAVLKTLIPRTEDLSFSFEEFGLEQPTNNFPIQSSDHVVEVQYVQWLCRLAAQIYKIANDLRFLMAKGLVIPEVEEGYAGSSCMPHKVNPYKFEKACSIANYVSGFQIQIWEVAAKNTLERTLDTSWAIKRILADVNLAFEKLLVTMINARVQINEEESINQISQHADEITSEMRLATKIFDDPTLNRWDVYQQHLKESQGKFWDNVSTK
jgi:adenylosuccinate lyase